MSATDQRDISAETSRIEDGLASLAAMLADMLAGTDRAGSGDSPDDSQDEVIGPTSPQNRRVPASELTPEIKIGHGWSE